VQGEPPGFSPGEDVRTTYDPSDRAYFDEGDLREEMNRVFDLCHGCRLCFNLCPSFPTLFDYVDSHDGHAEAMTASEQDRVVDECYQCKLCYLKCPYVPPHEWELDFPRLMMRANAVRRTAHPSLAESLADQALNRTDLVGRVSVALAPLVNAVVSKPGTFVRRLMESTVGIAAERALPTYSRRRFTRWFARRNRPILRTVQRSVAVFPTCFIEYMEPGIGRDTVKVLERNGVACSVPEGARCCGAPWLHSGDVRRFVAQAKRNVEALAPEVAGGKDVIVAQPTCAYVLRKDYPIYVGGEDAEMVAAHTFEPSEYLMKMRSDEGSQLDTEFTGEVPERVVYHISCHHQALQTGLRARDLLRLAGAEVTLVQKCSGIDGTWGYRASHYVESKQVARPMLEAVRSAAAPNLQDAHQGAALLKVANETGPGPVRPPVVMGDCHLANTAIAEETGYVPMHPMQVLARAYGIPEEVDQP
jgi:glycerol-3-phosphate dehydrogenase subunit C